MGHTLTRSVCQSVHVLCLATITSTRLKCVIVLYALCKACCSYAIHCIADMLLACCSFHDAADMLCAMYVILWIIHGAVDMLYVTLKLCLATTLQSTDLFETYGRDCLLVLIELTLLAP